jgi:hypothetical protein
MECAFGFKRHGQERVFQLQSSGGGRCGHSCVLEAVLQQTAWSRRGAVIRSKQERLMLKAPFYPHHNCQNR